MKGFKNFKIGAKLVFGFSVMILIMGLIGFTGFMGITKIEHHLAEIFSVRLPSIDYLIEADRDLQQLLVAERSMIFANAKSDTFKKMIADYEENLAQSQQRWEKYKALPATPEEAAIMPKYEKAREAWKAISGKVVAGRAADTREGRREALDLTLGPASEKFEEMRDYLDKLTNINLKMAQDAHDASVDVYQNAIITLMGTAGAGLLAGLFSHVGHRPRGDQAIKKGDPRAYRGLRPGGLGFRADFVSQPVPCRRIFAAGLLHRGNLRIP